jgi:hypothetical protein
MPQDLTCPKCGHAFPVTETRQPFGVQCPACDVEITAEFRKIAKPEPGQPPYDLLAKLGKHTAPEIPKEKALKLDDDEEGEKKRKGGSMIMVVVVGVTALLITLGGLGATGYYLFTHLETHDRFTINRSGGSSGGNQGGNKGGNPGQPKKDEPQKPKDTFELKPLAGAVPTIAPCSLDATTPQTVLLPGRADSVAVGGGGRYLVFLCPEQGRLAVFDANTGALEEATCENGRDNMVAAGSNKFVLITQGGKKARVYSLPEMKPENEFDIPFFFGTKTAAMGSKTNGPLLVGSMGAEVMLFDIATGKQIEGANQKIPGIPERVLRPTADGKLFIAGNGQGEKFSILDESKQKWRLRSPFPDILAAYPSPDGKYIYGQDQIIDNNGKAVAGKGAGTGKVWYVPAVTSTGNYFMKLTEVKSTSTPRQKNAVSLSIHKDVRNVDKPVIPAFEGLQETERMVNANSSEMLDRHLFLIPEAKLLVILPVDKTKLILRKVDLK